MSDRKVNEPKRARIGHVVLSDLLLGQWRFLRAQG